MLKEDIYVQEFANKLFENSDNGKYYELGAATGIFKMLKAVKPFVSTTDYETIKSSCCSMTGAVAEHVRKMIEYEKDSDNRFQDIFDGYTKNRY